MEIERLRKENGIATVVMTHYHEDHFTFLSRLPDTPVWPRPRTPRPSSRSRRSPGTAWSGPSGDAFFRAAHGEVPFRRGTIGRTIADGSGLPFGKTRRSPSWPPGHTPGHLCLHFPDDGILFGDYDPTAFGPWYGDLTGDMEAFRRSALRLAGIAADRSVVSTRGRSTAGRSRRRCRRTSP